MFSPQQNQKRRGWNRIYLEAGSWGGGGMWGEAQIMHTYVSKCKNNKMKGEIKKINHDNIVTYYQV
jgi:hypothetical protein